MWSWTVSRSGQSWADFDGPVEPSEAETFAHAIGRDHHHELTARGSTSPGCSEQQPEAAVVDGFDGVEVDDEFPTAVVARGAKQMIVEGGERGDVDHAIERHHLVAVEAVMPDDQFHERGIVAAS